MSSVGFSDGMTLGAARDQLRPLAADGACCPLCQQNVKVYARTLTQAGARALIALYHADGTAHIPTLAKTTLPDVAHQGGALTWGAYWGLMVEDRVRREDGGRAGWWQLTDLGREFVLGRATIPKRAHTYNGRVLRVEGPAVTIRQALGSRFDYAKLMGAADIIALGGTNALRSLFDPPAEAA